MRLSTPGPTAEQQPGRSATDDQISALRDDRQHLRDLFRVLAHWPRERYLELAPKYWATTRARLVPSELDAELGELTIPEPLAPVAEEQSSPR